MISKLFFLLAGLVLFGSSAFAHLDLNFTKSKFIAAIVKSEEGLEVWINTRAYWEERRVLIDSYSPEDGAEVEKIVDQTDLCNLSESQYQPCRGDRSIEQIAADLERAGVEVDRDFQAWAEREISR
ncbi:MAG: hypothetical protein HC902_01050 [Calothrix sp. SM1_5_4]|nr:hypothetical protein [Calothrix sp. SM1_5_4]